MHRQKIYFAALALVVCLTSVQTAFAHATPESYEPAASSVLPAAPKTVRIRFSERIEPRASSIIIFTPTGEEITTHPVISPADPYLMVSAVSLTSTGTYAVSWSVVSADDGHFTKGAYLFSLGKEGGQSDTAGTSQFSIEHQTNFSEGITVFLEMLGQAILLGMLAVHIFLWKKLRMKFDLSTDEARYKKYCTLLCLFASLLIIGGVTAYLYVQAVDIQSSQQSQFFGALTIFVQTVAGRFALYRAVLGLIFILMFVTLRSSFFGSRFVTLGEIFLSVILLVIFFLRARVSHAAASLILPDFSIIINFIHLIFKDLWIGSLIVFVFLLLPIVQRHHRTKLTAHMLTSFSMMLNFAFAIGGLTGVYIVWLHLKSFSNILTTHWGLQFVALTASALLLLTLRFYQQLKVETSIERFIKGENTEKLRESFTGGAFAMLLEMVVGVAVLYFTSFLVITTPPLMPLHLFSESVDNRGAHITFQEHPYDNSQFLISITDASNKVSSVPENFIVTIQNSEKNIGPIVVTTQKSFSGGYIFPKKDFIPEGMWVIDVTAQRQNEYDATASFTIQYPEDIEALHATDEQRTFGVFEAVMILMAIGILGFASYLFRFTSRLRKKYAALPDDVIELPPFTVPYFWFVLIADAVIVIFLGLTLNTHNHGGFSTLCVKSGGVWEESSPMYKGKVTSPVTVMGCTVGQGQIQSHYADVREFTYRLSVSGSTVIK